MKKILLLPLLLAMIASLTSNAQILAPVRWSYGLKKNGTAEAVVFIKATIDNGWHIYSQHVKDGGPVKTSITFTPSKSYSTSGETYEPQPVTRLEKVFNMEVGYFENNVVFQQKIKLKPYAKTVMGTVEYMACNDRQCLPPDHVEFNIPIN